MFARSKLFYVLLTVIGMTLTACANEGAIRGKMLEKTPIGEAMSKVMAFCVREHLKCSRSDTAGYWDQTTGKPVGVKS
jgi:hypothetical protein